MEHLQSGVCSKVAVARVQQFAAVTFVSAISATGLCYPRLSTMIREGTL